MNRIVFLQKTWWVFLIWVLLPWPGPGDSPGAVTDRKTPKEVPGVETKIKQVPGEGAYTFPLEGPLGKSPSIGPPEKVFRSRTGFPPGPGLEAESG